MAQEYKTVRAFAAHESGHRSDTRLPTKRGLGILAILSLWAVFLAVAVCTANNTPPTIADVSAADITETGATIVWTTDEPATSAVSTTTGSPARPIVVGCCEESELVTCHRVTLRHLGPGLTYRYWVKSRDAHGNESVSEEYALTTLGTPTAAGRLIKVTQLRGTSGNFPDAY